MRDRSRNTPNNGSVNDDQRPSRPSARTAAAILTVLLLLAGAIVGQPASAVPDPGEDARYETYTWPSGVLEQFGDISNRTTEVTLPSSSPFKRVQLVGAKDESFGVGWNNPILNDSPSEYIEMKLTWAISANGSIDDNRFIRYGLNVPLAVGASVGVGAEVTATVVVPRDAYDKIATGQINQPMPFAPGSWPKGTMIRFDADLVLKMAGELQYRLLRLELGFEGSVGVAVGVVKVDEDTVRYFAGPTTSLAIQLNMGLGIDLANITYSNESEESRLIARFVDWRISPDHIMTLEEATGLWEALMSGTESNPDRIQDRGRVSIFHTTATESLRLNIGDFFYWGQAYPEGDSRVLQIHHDSNGSLPAWDELEVFATDNDGFGTIYHESSQPQCQRSRHALVQFEQDDLRLADTYRRAFNPTATWTEQPFAVTIKMTEEGLEQLKAFDREVYGDNGGGTSAIIQNSYSVQRLYAVLTNDVNHRDRLANHVENLQLLKGGFTELPGIKVSFGDVDWRALTPCVLKQQMLKGGTFHVREKHGLYFDDFSELGSGARVFTETIPVDSNDEEVSDAEFQAFNSFFHPDDQEIVQQVYRGNYIFARRTSAIGWSEFKQLPHEDTPDDPDTEADESIPKAAPYRVLDESNQALEEKGNPDFEFAGFNVFVDSDNLLTQELVVTWTDQNNPNDLNDDETYNRYYMRKRRASGWDSFELVTPHPITDIRDDGQKLNLPITAINTFEHPELDIYRQQVAYGNRYFSRDISNGSDRSVPFTEISATPLKNASPRNGRFQAFNARFLPSAN